MQVIMSGNGGWCHTEDVPMVCPECGNTKFRINEGESWVGHNKREFFMIAVCDNENCEKELDISIDVG